jgi:hypothetical protein
MSNEYTFCASRCANYDCDYHASNAEVSWNDIFWKDMHHTCKKFIPLDQQYTKDVLEGD